MFKIKLRAAVSATFAAASLGASTVALCQVVAYPEHNQSPKKQASDKGACEQFAKEQTGFDPQQAMAEAPPSSSAVRPRKQAKQNETAQSQMDAQNKQKLQAYDKAEAACLKGKGYSIG